MSDSLDNAMRVMAEQSRQIDRLRAERAERDELRRQLADMRAALAQYGIVDRQEDAA